MTTGRSVRPLGGDLWARHPQHATMGSRRSQTMHTDTIVHAFFGSLLALATTVCLYGAWVMAIDPLVAQVPAMVQNMAGSLVLLG